MYLTPHTKEMLLLTLRRLQYVPDTIPDSDRLKEMLHLIDAGGFSIDTKLPQFTCVCEIHTGGCLGFDCPDVNDDCDSNLKEMQEAEK